MTDNEYDHEIASAREWLGLDQDRPLDLLYLLKEGGKMLAMSAVILTLVWVLGIMTA